MLVADLLIGEMRKERRVTWTQEAIERFIRDHDGSDAVIVIDPVKRKKFNGSVLVLTNDEGTKAEAIGFEITGSEDFNAEEAAVCEERERRGADPSHFCGEVL